VREDDVLTYTVFFNNTSQAVAMASLTGTIPAYTTFLPGSASASDGGAVSWTGQALRWSGQVISGTPVIIEYGVKVLKAPAGAEIINTISMDDGWGQNYRLEARSVYDPLYWVTINNGALYTNMPTVTLKLSWSATPPPVTAMIISNDGNSEKGTQMPVTNQVKWRLTTYGNHILPRFVYVFFFDSLGTQRWVAQDDIIYDPCPPELDVDLIQGPTGDQLAGQGSQTLVRVTSRDDNSGVDRVLLSNRADFAPGSTVSYPVTSAVQAWPWSKAGTVYVKVTDRAGNVSAVKQATVQVDGTALYLPLIVKE
jgi:uncharacterized repeat protein (TIGR01451 family)